MLDDFLKRVVEKLPDKAMDSYYVVFTGRRPAYFLYGYLRGKGIVFPPKIFTLSEFFYSILSDFLPYYRANTLDLFHYLKISAQKHISDFSSWEVFFPWARELLITLEELEMNDIDDSGLSQVNGLLSGYDEDELFYALWDKMALIRRDFYSMLEGDRIFTYSMVLKALQGFVADISIDVVFAGLFALNKREIALLRRILDNEKSTVEFVFNSPDVPRIRESIDALSGVFNASVDFMPALPSNMEVVACPSMYGQILELDRRLPDEVENPKDVGIILPDPEVLFPLTDIICRGKRKFNITMGYPFSRTPMFQFINSLFNFARELAQGKFPVKLLLPVLRHPYVRHISSEGIAWAGVLFNIERRIAEAELGVIDFGDIKSLVGDEQQAVVSEFENKLALPILGASSLKELGRVLINIIDFIFNNNEQFRSSRINTEYSAVLRKILFDITSSRIGSENFSPEMLFKIVLWHLKSDRIPYVGSPLEGMQIMGALEGRNIGFDKLFFLNLNEGVYPPSISQGIILTDSICNALKMPSKRERELLFMYDFYSMLSLSKEAVLFFIDSAKEKGEMSRLIRQISWLNAENNSTCRFVKAGEIDLDLSNIRFVNDRKKPGDMSKFVSRISSTLIDTYLKCPMMFFYRYIAHMEQPLSREFSPEPKDIGIIVHDALSSLYLPYVNENLSSQVFDRIARQVKKQVGKSAEKTFTKSRIALKHTDMILKVIESRLEAFVYADKKRWERDGFKLHFIEDDSAKGTGMTAPININGRDFLFYGRADRIDRLGNGVFLIIDYKTGARKAPNVLSLLESGHLSRKSLYELFSHSVQLPLYVLLFSKVNNVRFRDINAGFWDVRDSSLTTLFTEKLNGRKEEFMLVFNNYLEGIISHIFSSDFDLTADKDSCAYCPYKDLCYS